MRALLAHPGAMAVISALLNRGETERVHAEDAAAAAAAPPPPAVADALAAWRAATEALGAAYLEAE